MRKRTNDPDGHAQRAARECPRCRRPWPSNEPQTDTEGERRIEERVAILRAHRVVTNEESDTNHGRYAGSCIVCGTEWPCVYHPPRPPEGAGEAGPTCPHCDLPYDAHAPGCPNRGETRAPVTPPKTVPGWKLPEKARGPDSDQGDELGQLARLVEIFGTGHDAHWGASETCSECITVRRMLAEMKGLIESLRASTGERIEPDFWIWYDEETGDSQVLPGDGGPVEGFHPVVLLHPTDGGEV